MTRNDLQGLTKSKLLHLAKERALPCRSSMTRDELIKGLAEEVERTPELGGPERPKETLQVRGIEARAEAVGPAPEPAYVEPPLPGPYGDTRIVLMARDPFWVHAYWEIEQARYERLAHEFGCWDHVPLTLRTFDLESGHWFDVAVSPHSFSWYIYVGEANRSYCVEVGVSYPHGFTPIARSNSVLTPRDGVSQVVDEEWMIVDEHFRRLYQLAGMPGGASEALVGGFVSRLERESLMGSGGVSSISSPVSWHGAAERQFWLIVNTELILYGATQPGSKVTVRGEPVTVKPDGTFAIRLALPDGVAHLPVEAHSPDGVETIRVTPVVTKQST